VTPWGQGSLRFSRRGLVPAQGLTATTQGFCNVDATDFSLAIEVAQYASHPPPKEQQVNISCDGTAAMILCFG
jgi:hypothetical protein